VNWPKMTTAEIAAFIGAAAWLPQIGQWIYGWFAKPKLRVTSGPTVEMGHTESYGPIANMTLAISTSRKDAIVEKMTVQATHEQGDTHLLTWVVLNETQSQIRNLEGEILEVSKQQPAIALKVSTLALSEKKVLFQDLAYQEQHKQLTSKMGELYAHLHGNKEEEIGEKVIKSPEFAKARDHFRDGMYWREGKYLFLVGLHEIQTKNPHVERFEVVVTKSHVDALRRNTDHFEMQIRAMHSTVEDKVEDQKPFPIWNWVYPVTKRLK